MTSLLHACRALAVELAGARCTFVAADGGTCMKWICVCFHHLSQHSMVMNDAQVDPYVKANVRENRTARTRTLMNNNKPVWDETFNLIVDDPQTQSVTFIVMDDDLGAFDDVRSRPFFPAFPTACPATCPRRALIQYPLCCQHCFMPHSMRVSTLPWQDRVVEQ